MEINLNLKAGPVPRASSDAPAVRRAGPPNEAVAQFTESQALNLALADVPDLRVDVVERARLLIGQADYPPQEMLRQLANLFAMHLAGDDQEQPE